MVLVFRIHILALRTDSTETEYRRQILVPRLAKIMDQFWRVYDDNPLIPESANNIMMPDQLCKLTFIVIWHTEHAGFVLPNSS
jgi:hypothetical protein